MVLLKHMNVFFLSFNIFFIFHYLEKNPDFYEISVLVIYSDIRYQDKKSWEQTCPA